MFEPFKHYLPSKFFIKSESKICGFEQYESAFTLVDLDGSVLNLVNENQMDDLASAYNEECFSDYAHNTIIKLNINYIDTPLNNLIEFN